MRIAILAPGDYAIDEVLTGLRREGLDVFSVPSNVDLHCVVLPYPIEKAVLVIPRQGVVDVGEETSLVRMLLGPATPLLLCTSQPGPQDRRILHECGASEIVTPQTWMPHHVTERILAQFIINGGVNPSNQGALRGGTRQMRELYHHIEKLAPLSETVLILGETGTGKGLVAKELHLRSKRPEPFLPVHCPQHSRELLPSELFGYERGAFTGAVQARRGMLAEAEMGTVFLDEIGELDPTAQAQLLRAIEEKEVLRVGGNRWEKIHARIILATNRDLREDSEMGRFRKDLFERIRGFLLEVPPLRERSADIPLLVNHFVEEYNHEYERKLTVPAGAVECLFRYEWPGNVRELRTIVRKAAVYSDDATGHISAALLQEAVRGREPVRSRRSIKFDPRTETWRGFMDRAEAAYFKAVLSEANGNVTLAAKLAGMSRSHFYTKLEEIKIAESQNVKQGGFQSE